MLNKFPVAIIGGGPVGLAAAAHLIKRNMKFVLIEQGASVGASIKEWGHVRMFSPWKYNIDQAAEALLLANGWAAPDAEQLPTGNQLVDEYLSPFARLPEVEPHLVMNSTVVGIHRYGIDKVKTAGRESFPFEITMESKDGQVSQLLASAVIDATGTWRSPNPAGASGSSAIGELEVQDQVTYGIPNATAQRNRYAGKRVAVIGSGHSAINSILELSKLQIEEPAASIIWVLRKGAVEDTYGGGAADALPARGQLGLDISDLIQMGRIEVVTAFRTQKIEKQAEKLKLIGMRNHATVELEAIDELVVNTGARPDFAYLREVRVQADPALECVPALADLIDPNVHSCGTVRPHGEAELRQPEMNFYIVGSKSYGRAPTFLMATGYEQVRSLVAALAGDWDAARRVELNLPETGVCSVSNIPAVNSTIAVGSSSGTSSCCG